MPSRQNLSRNQCRSQATYFAGSANTFEDEGRFSALDGVTAASKQMTTPHDTGVRSRGQVRNKDQEIRKSSFDLPRSKASFIQSGWRPRPVQVWLGFSG